MLQWRLPVTFHLTDKCTNHARVLVLKFFQLMQGFEPLGTQHFFAVGQCVFAEPDAERRWLAGLLREHHVIMVLPPCQGCCHTPCVCVLAHLVDPGPLYREPVQNTMRERVKEMAQARPRL